MMVYVGMIKEHLSESMQYLNDLSDGLCSI